MAGDADKEDKTQEASAKRLQQAREEGRAPLSREVAGLAVLGSGGVLLSVFLPGAVRGSVGALTQLLANTHALDLPTALRLARQGLLGVVWPFAVASMLAAVVAVMGQTRFLLKTSALLPDFSKLNPLNGLGRVFGPQHLMESGKSLLKMLVMGFVGWRTLAGMAPILPQALFWTPGWLAAQIIRQVLSVLVAILAVQGVIAAVDVLRTHLRFHADMRMTRQEQRDEARDSDGDPHIKGKLKQMRLQRSRRRMLQAVPQATLVVTNPTHYAVALVYERGAGGAPRIVAKGMDEMAARIRAAAQAAGVPLVANPPLARALFPLPLDHEIPPEHFQAVAELIAYVWRLKSGRAAAPAGRRA